jgi:gas vesicle protein
MSENNGTPVGGYLAAFGIGALLGVGVALLTAPRSGKETRDRIAQRALDLKNDANGILEDAQGMVHEKLEGAQEMIREKQAVIAAAVAAAKEAMRDPGAKPEHSA